MSPEMDPVSRIGRLPGWARNLSSAVPPRETTEDAPFFLGSTVFDAEVTKSVDFLAEYSFRVLNEVSGTYTHHVPAKVSTEFIGDWTSTFP